MADEAIERRMVRLKSTSLGMPRHLCFDDEIRVSAYDKHEESPTYLACLPREPRLHPTTVGGTVSPTVIVYLSPERRGEFSLPIVWLVWRVRLVRLVRLHHEAPLERAP